jgi:hypothetical protein
MYQYLEKIKQRANYSASVMETVNHLENGAKPKCQMSKNNSLTSEKEQIINY